MKNKRALLLTIVLILGGLWMVVECAFIVYPTEQVLVLEFGEPKRVIQEPGLHWKLPFVETLLAYEKRILALDLPPEEIIMADRNRIVVDSTTRYRIRDPLLFYQKAGNESRAAQLLGAQITPGLRKTLGTVKFEDVLSEKREGIMHQVWEEAVRSAKDLGVDIVDVRIRRADVPQQNSESIYRRMNSERERFAKELRAKGKERAQAIRAEADRQSTVIIAAAQKEAAIERGKGDGEAARIYAEAYAKHPDFYTFYRALQAYDTTLAQSSTPVTIMVDPKENAFFSHL